MSEKKKVISVMIPTYNEEENARPIYEAVRDRDVARAQREMELHLKIVEDFSKKYPVQN